MDAGYRTEIESRGDNEVGRAEYETSIRISLVSTEQLKLIFWLGSERAAATQSRTQACGMIAQTSRSTCLFI